MQVKPKTKTQTKKTFEWNISSATISFIRTNELEAARDGSANDCSKVSPLPQPKRKPGQRTDRQE